jgi:hypothetical protein
MKYILVAAALLASSAAHAQNYRDVWDDVRKPWRLDSEMDAALQADALACERQVGEQFGRVSSAYQKCMARHHWRLNRVERLPVEPDHHDPIPDTFPASSEPSLPDTSPVQPIIPDTPPPPDIHPFCPDTIC